MKKILLTSGSDIFLKRNTNLLREKGGEILTAKSGAEAFTLLENDQIDLTIIDLQLADMGGSSFCSRVRRSKPRHEKLPLILISLNLSISIERAEQSGASAILLKPVDPDQLLDTIGSFIELEKRRNKRIMLNTEVLIRKPGVEFLCLSRDISNTGILIETGYHIELGSRISCRFSLPDSLHVENEGEVIRYMSSSDHEHLYGIRFVDLNVSYRRAIDNFLYAKKHPFPIVRDRHLHTHPSQSCKEITGTMNTP